MKSQFLLADVKMHQHATELHFFPNLSECNLNSSFQISNFFQIKKSFDCIVHWDNETSDTVAITDLIRDKKLAVSW